MQPHPKKYVVIAFTIQVVTYTTQVVAYTTRSGCTICNRLEWYMQPFEVVYVTIWIGVYSHMGGICSHWSSVCNHYGVVWCIQLHPKKYVMVAHILGLHTPATWLHAPREVVSSLETVNNDGTTAWNSVCNHLRWYIQPFGMVHVTTWAVYVTTCVMYAWFKWCIQPQLKKYVMVAHITQLVTYTTHVVASWKMIY